MKIVLEFGPGCIDTCQWFEILNLKHDHLRKNKKNLKKKKVYRNPQKLIISSYQQMNRNNQHEAVEMQGLIVVIKK